MISTITVMTSSIDNVVNILYYVILRSAEELRNEVLIRAFRVLIKNKGLEERGYWRRLERIWRKFRSINNIEYKITFLFTILLHPEVAKSEEEVDRLAEYFLSLDNRKGKANLGHCSYSVTVVTV